MATRTLGQVIASVPTSDGAGVKLRRSLGSQPSLRLDPFLMLDEFGTENPDDYIAGFPPHPHRGFETVTYMLDGHMRHEDHLGNVGELTEGGVQWMTAGRGIIHSEMPQQNEGRMRGFQLWINLPAAEKMTEPKYRDLPAARIPLADLSGGQAKVIAGTLESPIGNTTGPVSGLTTEPVFFDLHLDSGAIFEHPVPPGHNAFVYVYEGRAVTGPAGAEKEFFPQAAAVLNDGDRVRLCALEHDTRMLLLAGKPLNEPIVQRGPFVMNTDEEIRQAIDDYQNGTLT
ncbi:MAG: pirin family protein [Gammaproteobacteria bacterium]|nr:pirin family protein [Gammaproteobacteria bacterium]NNF60939.1 pirin family protein [Gammaproteobacteria bacterium]NNM20844.1 pirin family protein [Gammaproteobacteria bacterium]